MRSAVALVQTVHIERALSGPQTFEDRSFLLLARDRGTDHLGSLPRLDAHHTILITNQEVPGGHDDIPDQHGAIERTEGPEVFLGALYREAA